MKVFLSWSGEASKAVATALYDWLPNVIQSAQPWISNHDIPSGSRWSLHVGEQLQELKTGILCLTPDNLSSPWILFEAGALSKALDDSLVCPYLFKVEPTAVEWPLGQFQLETADKEGTRKLLVTINNAASDGKLEPPRLQESFDMWWPRLEEKLAGVEPVQSAVPRRLERDILEEILTIVRQLSRDTPERVSSEALRTLRHAGILSTQKEAVAEAYEKGIAAAIGDMEKLLLQKESEADAALREARLKLLRQLALKKDKKDGEN